MTLPGYLSFYRVFVMIGVDGWLCHFTEICLFLSEQKFLSLSRSNKEISEELDSLRNVAVGEEFSFSLIRSKSPWILFIFNQFSK